MTLEQKDIQQLDIASKTFRRQNKNDFYRFLLSKNDQCSKLVHDILIPHSILKRNNPGNLIKDQRLQDATIQYLNYQKEQPADEMAIGKYDALFGKHIKVTSPMLSPKV